MNGLVKCTADAWRGVGMAEGVTVLSDTILCLGLDGGERSLVVVV